ncbi:hypothetical protein BDZ89DRAFT_374931 [Hymenopellis radicata]|nr:hypothetical protein BDZ89DRAFT_374931 [Hymenopellis radicata]
MYCILEIPFLMRGMESHASSGSRPSIFQPQSHDDCCSPHAKLFERLTCKRFYDLTSVASYFLLSLALHSFPFNQSSNILVHHCDVGAYSVPVEEALHTCDFWEYGGSQPQTSIRVQEPFPPSLSSSHM